MSEIISCKDCGEDFEFTDGERSFFAEHGLSDPKRCYSCRAARQGIEDKTLICARCRESFIYPRELQLLARTHRWDPPVTCLGGCLGKKHAIDKLSAFEKTAYAAVGEVSQYFKIKSNTHQKLKIPNISGFDDSGLITNREIQNYVCSVIPENHLNQVKAIVFSNDFFQLEKTGSFSRGFYFDKTIVINRSIDKESATKYKEVILHEIGHVAYDLLSDEKKYLWHTLSESNGPVSETAKLYWANEDARDYENFSEAYRLYIQYPAFLFASDQINHDLYYFMINEVFETENND